MADINFDGLEFNYGPGNADWFVQSSVYHTAPNALQGGDINDSQVTRIDLVNPGAGDLSFYWKVSSEGNYDFLEFYINGIRQDRISGEVDWVQKTYTLTGTETSIYWQYRKDSSVTRGSDTGWIDTITHPGQSISSSSVSSSSTSLSSSSSSSAAQTSYILPNSNLSFTLSGPGGTGLASGTTGGRWNYRSTTTGSSQTGPSVPPPGPDIYYWFCETSGTSLGSVFTMTLNDILDSSLYNFTINFFYSNYGSTGGGECLVQYWNGATWDTVQTIGWDTLSDAWKAATPIDLSSYMNADGQIRWVFTTGGTTTYRNDFAMDWIRIIADLASSSSSSVSSSSVSSSSSISISSATWTWGHQTGVPTGYAVTFSNGRLLPWIADEIDGSGDSERIIMEADGRYAWSEPAYTGAGENIYLLYNRYAGSRDDSKFTILYRTGTTRQDCLASGWRTYSQLDEPLTSLGWIQFSFTMNSVSSSSTSSSSSSSMSLDCSWESFNGGLSDWDIYQDEGVNLASWNGSVWSSVIHHLDSDISGGEYGAAEYIYLVPKSWSFEYRNVIYARITHNRNLSQMGGPNPYFQILAANSSKIVDESYYISDTVVPMTFGPAGDMALFKFYHTGATPFQVSNIEFCRSSSSSSVSSSSSTSSSSSSSSCVPGWIETEGPSNWNTFRGSWNGSGYDSDANGNWEVLLNDNGTGVVGGWYPIKIRVTVEPVNLSSPSMLFIRALDTDENILYDTGSFVFPDSNPLDVVLTPVYVPDGEGGFYDLEDIRFSGGSKEFKVNSVQFYEDCDTGSFSSSSSSSSVSSSSTSSSSFSAAIEDLTTYSLFQTGPAYLSTNTWPGPISRCTWSGLTVNTESVCYFNKAASLFAGNFRVDFEFSMSQHFNIANNDTLMLCCVGDIPGTYTEIVADNDGVMVLVHSGPVQECSLRLYCANNTNSSIIPISATPLPVGTVYCRLTRVGSTATIYAYSDALRTVLIGSTSIVVSTNTWDYFTAVASIEGIGAYWSTGLAQQFQIWP